MGIKDVFHRRGSGSSSGGSADPESAAEGGGATQDAPARDDEPGSVSSQLDVEGRGPVTLDERTKPGGQASPDTSQGTTEPMPATPGQADPTAPVEPPLLQDMNVGGADPQLPEHPLARPRDEPQATGPTPLQEPGVAPDADRPALDVTGSSPPEGPERPAQATPGTAQRAPGSLGTSPDQQETDVQTGAAAMRPGGGAHATPAPVQPGDAQEVSVPHEVPTEGTSQTAPIVHGVRTPEPLQE